MSAVFRWLVLLVGLSACAAKTNSPPPRTPSADEALPPTALAQEPPRAPVPADEASVRPGINARYFREGSVARTTKVLEAESREVVEHRDAIVAAMGLRPGMDVADIGAGTGLFTNAIAETVGTAGRVYAVDIVPDFVDRVQRRADDEGLTQVVAALGDERATGLESSSVDLVFMCDTYHHIEYPQNYLSSLFQTLRPGGVLVLIDFERIPGFTSPQIMQHVRAGKQTVVEEVTAAGFVLDTQVDLLSENYYLRFKRP